MPYFWKTALTIATALSFAGVCPPAIAVEPSRPAQVREEIPLYRQSVNHYRQGRYGQAIATLNQLLQQAPEFAAAYHLRAQALTALGDTEAALADYGEAVRQQPDFTAAYVNRGLLYYSLSQYEAAIADYERAIALDPDLSDTYVNRGNAYAALGRSEEALADYNRALDRNGNSGMAYYNRAQLQEARGDSAAALADYEAALAVLPEGTATVPVYLSRSTLYLNSGNPDAAIADCNRILAIAPNTPEAYGNRGLAYGVLGERDRAVADLSRAAQLFAQQGREAEVRQVRQLLRQLQDGANAERPRD